MDVNLFNSILESFIFTKIFDYDGLRSKSDTKTNYDLIF